MKLKNTHFIAKCVANIEMFQAMQKSLDATIEKLRSFNRHDKIDCGTLHQTIVQLELAAWRHLFLWCMTITDAERVRIKAMAFDRFLRPDADVAHWLAPGGRTPDSWLTADEDEFRAMAAAAFAPKDAP